MTRKLALIALGLLVSLPALAGSEWRKIPLRATNGAEIQVNYQVQEVVRGRGRTLIAAPLWIDVTSSNNGRLHAVVLNFRSDPITRQITLMQEFRLDLSSVGTGYRDRRGNWIPGRLTRYYGEVKGGLPISMCSGADCDQFFQEIAFVDEKGEWYLDPISRSHNFQFSLR